MSYRTPDYHYLRHPPTLTERVLTATAVALFAVFVVTFVWLYVDQEHYVSDDARDGRAAIAPFLAGDPKPAALRVTRECVDLVCGIRDRADRHFMFGCSGVWFPPPPDETD